VGVESLFPVLVVWVLAVLVVVLVKRLVVALELLGRVLRVAIVPVNLMHQEVVAVLVLSVVTVFLTAVDLVALEHLILFPEQR
jgi:hypothetical protein